MRGLLSVVLVDELAIARRLVLPVEASDDLREASADDGCMKAAHPRTCTSTRPATRAITVTPIVYIVRREVGNCMHEE